MNAADVNRQIKQMVQFIKQEAQEKANEIKLAAEEEFNIEKLQLIEAEKLKVRKEYERKDQQIAVKKKIEYSTQLNAARLKVLQARDDSIQKIKEDVAAKLIAISSGPQYKNLLRSLISQGLAKLGEKEVLVRCREMDVQLVKEVLKSAAEDYAKSAKVPVPTVELDSAHLPAPSTSGNHGPSCSGGVILASKDRRIVCGNTLDERLNISYGQNLPQIRKMLFGNQKVVA
eukprot:jgi/Chlat1/916/Chrsp108S01354